MGRRKDDEEKWLISKVANFSETVRAFEERIYSHLDEIQCPTHLSLGQEFVSGEIHKYIKKDDWLFSTHRNHGHYLAKGGSEEKLWDEIRGLKTGINRGQAGSQCFSDPSINFHASSIVGGSIGIAVGTALALKGSGKLVVCCFGDAATETGIFWESLGFSVLKQLPIFFVCENNGMSVNIPIHERQSGEIIRKVMGFGIATVNDIGTGFSLGRTLPVFIEVKSKRVGDHCYFPKQ